MTWRRAHRPVLRSAAQRVVLERIFAAQALLVGALDESGRDWIKEERRRRSLRPNDEPPDGPQPAF
jgi:hypothetical protein